MADILNKEPRPVAKTISPERLAKYRAQIAELLRERQEFLRQHGSVNDVTSDLGLTPITGRSGPRLFY